MRGILSILIALAFLMPYAGAADFSAVATPTSTDVCPGQHTSYRLDVTNTNSQDSITITVKANSTWASIAPTEQRLGGGEMRSFWVFVQPDLSASAGTYVINAVVSQGLQSANVPLTVNVQSCFGILLTSQPVHTCSAQFIHDLRIKNIGKTKEKFYLSSTEPWVTVDQSIDLAADEEKTIPMHINSSLGSSNFTINAVSLTSYAKSSMNIKVERENCYDVKFYINDISVCQYEPKNAIVKVKNFGTRPDNLTITSTNSNLSANLYLKSGEARDLPASVNGDWFEVKAVSEHLVESINKSVNYLPADQCYGLTMRLERSKITINHSSNTLVVGSVRNNGKLAESVALLTQAPPWVEIVPTNFTLDTNQSEKLYIYLAPPYQTTGSYNVSITSVTPNFNTTEILSIRVLSEGEAEIDEPVIQLEGSSTKTETRKISALEVIKFIISPILNLFDFLGNSSTPN